MALKPEVTFTTVADLFEEDSLPDEPTGSSRCPECGRFAHLESAPTVDHFGNDVWQVRCAVHGLVWTKG